ncbi:DHA2 family efflux MFS transporter permease subunit [Phenylobacterium sp. LjRoot225]|uniref:DHA2 family efflux MFS transporter permease subunit n=1 Tax=Phenylobacterium sp. LjRoot225 TaxID=3342285 RepID=UPI003ED0F9B0
MSSAEGLATRVIATGGLMLATLMVTIDMTIANVALPHMQGSLSASQDQMTWVLTSYILATAIMTPLSGWLSMKIGRKRLFLISVVSFVAMSLLCGIATSLPEMVLFRLLQGLAGASMMPISQATLLDLWPQRYTAQVMAVWSAVVMAAPILGPTLGGYLTEEFSWRWCFYVNVPLGAVGFIGVYFFLPRDAGGRERPFDMLGFAALVLFSASLQLMVDRGPSRDWFESAEIWTYAVVALCGLHVFVMQTLTADHPFFHRDLFLDRNFTSCLVFGVLLSAVLFGSIAMLPVFMQHLMGYSALQSGMVSVPRGVGSVLAFTVVPWLGARAGLRRTMLIGALMNIAALWHMGHFDLAMTATPIKVTGFLQGFGQGLMFNPMSVISFATLPAVHRTEAAVLGGMLRNLGGSLGIALAGAFQIRRSALAHEGLAAQIIPSDPMIRWALPEIVRNAGEGLLALNAEVTRQASMIGYDAAFGWMFIASIAMLPLLLLMQPARRRPGTVIEVNAD